jgi:cullin 2
MKVSGPMQSETQTEKQETHQQIDVDRQLYLQALVVRIMKTRKRLHHNQLVENIIKEAKPRFAPSIGSIKKCIEGLIEKAYIERDNKSRDEYLYVA